MGLTLFDQVLSLLLAITLNSRAEKGAHHWLGVHFWRRLVYALFISACSRCSHLTRHGLVQFIVAVFALFCSGEHQDYFWYKKAFLLRSAEEKTRYLQGIRKGYAC